MITLRVDPYSKRELEKLTDMLTALEIHLNNQVCKHGQCATCHYLNLCDDITSARKYAEKLCRETDRK